MVMFIIAIILLLVVVASAKDPYRPFMKTEYDYKRKVSYESPGFNKF